MGSRIAIKLAVCYPRSMRDIKECHSDEVKTIDKPQPTPKPKTYASVLAAPPPPQKVKEDFNSENFSITNTGGSLSPDQYWVISGDTSGATSPEPVEVKAPPHPTIWDIRKAKFGSRVNRQPLNRGIPFSQGTGYSKVINAVETNQIEFDPAWRQVVEGRNPRRTGARYMIVKTSRAMQVMVDTIASCWKSNEVTMIVDLEGENLGDTDGTTDLLSIYHIPTKHAFIVQLAVLGRRAFDITASGGWTLGSLLEDPNTLKGLWDVRNDAAGLYRCYRIKLRGVLDVQLMWCKVKHMTEDKRRRLEVAMVDFINMTAEDEAAFQSTEERGRLLWNPDRGGDFSVFQEEELQQTIILYCLADVVLLAEIMEGLWKYLTKESMATVRDKSREACNKSFSETYYSGWTPRKVANPFYKAGNMRRERLRLEDDIEELRRKNNRSRQEVEVAAGLW